jgi:hypothetical protein
MVETGGPAFPTVTERMELREHGYRPVNDLETGLTLRDYFAAKAMASLHTSAAILGQIADRRGDSYVVTTDELVAGAYAVADAMLKERAK